MLKNVVAESEIDPPRFEVASPAPHAAFGSATRKAGGRLPNVTSHPDAVKRQLFELQSRVTDVLGHSLVRHPATTTLRRIGQTLLTNVRWIHETRHSEIVARERHDPEAVQIRDILRSSHRDLDTIVSQIALCESTMRETLAVAAWGRRIVAQEPLKLYKLLPLFDRICDENRRVPDLWKLMPIAGIPLASLVESQTGEADAANFVVGVTTARVLVWLLGGHHRQLESLRRLVLAALLQDVGRLPVNCGGLSVRALRENRANWLEQQHPAIGAALCGSIRGAPVELPMLVAQHHEQLAGGGFPRALANDGILPEAAILAATGRFAELCLVPPDVTLARRFSPAGSSNSIVWKSPPMLAAETLVAEAELGKWPLEFSKILFRRVAESNASECTQPLDDVGEISGEIRNAGIELCEPLPANSTGDERTLQWHDQEKSLHGAHAGSIARRAGIAIGERKSRIDNG